MAFNLSKIEPQQKSKQTFDLEKLLKTEISFGSAFSNKKKEAFYTELSVLLQAGIQLKEALQLISNEQKKKNDQQLLSGIVEAIISGGSLSDSIKENKNFTEYEYYSLKIGEETGTLAKVAKELGLFFKRKNEQKRTVLNALSYPIVVLITALLAVFFMLRYMVPMFADIFKQNQVELPWLTKMIMQVSILFQEYAWVFLMLCQCSLY